MKRIKEMREAAGLTAKELARRCGVSGPSISQYENGERTPSLTVILLIAEELGTTVDYLTEKTDNPYPFDWGGVDGELIEEISKLTPAEKERVLAFIAGIKAGRR